MKLDDFVVCQLQTSFSIAHLFYFNHLLSLTPPAGTFTLLLLTPSLPFLLILSSLVLLLCSILVSSSSPFFLFREASPHRTRACAVDRKTQL
ncbi:hypothetical protein V8C40DRAFT_89659 [Trichoderma camerunense]